MKKIFISSIIYLFSTNILIADEHKCSGMKKLSKEYLACTAKNIKEGAVKKKDQVKEGSIKKINQDSYTVLHYLMRKRLIRLLIKYLKI